MKKINVKILSKLAIVSAIYIGLTLAVAPLSFGLIQFRFSEILVLLCFYNPYYSLALILGCFVSNIYSPLGLYDLAFGVLSTVFSVLGIILIKKFMKESKYALFTASLFPTISMLFIAYELHLIGQPFWFSLLTTSIGEFVVVSCIGVPLFAKLGKNEEFIKLIGK